MNTKTVPAINLSQEVNRITQFIQSTLKSAKYQTAVIALSGGIDSAVSLMLTVKAIKTAHVHVYHLPAKSSSPDSLKHARLIAKTANLPDENFHLVPIGAVIQKSWRILKHFDGNNSPTDLRINRLRLANLAARIRMMVIFDAAKKHQGLVVGTENLSEHLLGYYTRFGDEASDIEPLRHLYKTQVITIAKHLKVPPEIIHQPPSADLWPGQTDAGELGFTYEAADPILYHLQQGKSVSQITQLGFNSSLVGSVAKVVHTNAFKHSVPYKI